LFGVSRSTVLRSVRRLNLRPLRLGTAFVFREGEVLQLRADISCSESQAAARRDEQGV
jgi:hypothetical protein